ncbi:GPI ethanolamine phosphate transferase 1 [Aspergillus brunneoviolaceus CBS 621.78]|uniref:PigN-domain-containing protein n=1 Tax=Aspergillus brunneoviolaceus CBS 621.78 TaxID=1450534 RepID=A0ACD1FYL1_9EURO|nr:PigN-domain-containing protein [Aspergillus brunneoviolaceus CBS 621.78]RAH42102.1 PigN-domain-containing protein [Aspergillus brunneoviolaceus CBS 621.78]
MARLKRSQFLGIAVVFHLLYVYSIFDIYFVSPVVGGMKAHRVQASPPAQRVVLFVGRGDHPHFSLSFTDGLRADKTFQQFPDPSPDAPTDGSAQVPRHLAPFLRSRVLEHGTFGVSHTRVPTESRPGHVALLAGLYEDVSAVTTGWKLNPVGFDSVLNRSRHAWSWGSPDILPMFAQGAAPGRVEVGRLPLPYLDADESSQADAMLVNALEVLEMYRVRESRMIASKLGYVPFPALSHDQDPNQEERIARIRTAIRQGHPQEAIQGCEDLIDLSLQGLRYLQTYDWLFLRALISVGYLGWMAFALTNALSHFDLPSSGTSPQPRRSTVRLIVMGFVGLALLVKLYSQKSPVQYYAYTIFPVLFWAEVWARQDTWTQAIRALSKRISASNVTADAAGVMLLGLLLEAIVQSYYDRRIYTLIYILALFWPAIYGVEFIRANRLICLVWAVQCGSMSIFTLLPAMKTEDITLITLGGLLMFSCGVFYIILEPTILHRASVENVVETDRLGRMLLMFQVGLVPLAISTTRSAAASLQSLRRTLSSNSDSRMDTTRRHHIYQLVVLFFTFAPLFIILTISYEGLFYCCLSGTLFTWVQLESKVFDYQRQPASPSITQEAPQFRPLRFSDLRIALFFLYLFHSAFFSTGNLASISSFSLDAVLRLLPVFDPFSQGALLVLKILAPFVLVSANLGLLTRALRLRPGALFVLVVAASDYLTLRFFWRVRDEGSWLEIGESITVFVLASLLCGFVAGLEMVGEGVVGVAVGTEKKYKLSWGVC